jgi:hypothetical protein
MLWSLKVLPANLDDQSGVLIEPPLLAQLARANGKKRFTQHQPHSRL